MWSIHALLAWQNNLRKRNKSWLKVIIHDPLLMKLAIKKVSSVCTRRAVPLTKTTRCPNHQAWCNVVPWLKMVRKRERGSNAMKKIYSWENIDSGSWANSITSKGQSVVLQIHRLNVSCKSNKSDFPSTTLNQPHFLILSSFSLSPSLYILSPTSFCCALLMTKNLRPP